jgi:tRNA(fMet)-specific endonuclease VapC
MMYLLDTDAFGRGNAGQRNIAGHIDRVGASNVAITVVTLIEIRRGRHEFLLKAADGAHLMRAQQLLDASEITLTETQIIPIDHAAAAEFDRFRNLKNLRKIGRADLLIGCIAIAHRATLVTRNIRHFRQIPGLIIENWID